MTGMRETETGTHEPPACTHRWHSGSRWRGFAAPYIIYTTTTGPGGLTAQARECCGCGFRTVRAFDDEDNDITESLTQNSWKPSFVSRVRESCHELVINRRHKRMARRGCKVCGEIKSPAGWSETDYWCSDCLNRLLGGVDAGEH